MVVMEKRPELTVVSGYEAELRVESEDISFHDLSRDKVRIQVRVRNTGAGRSEPQTMILQSAPLGAFVPWRPLAQVLVPALEPGESQEVSTEVRRPTPAPLGNFDRVPPRRLLTAVNAPDQPARSNPVARSLVNLLRRGQTGRSSDPGRGESLAPDLWDLLGSPRQHWAGNINVFVGPRPVERHVAKALRIYPGRTNLAMFVVGSPGSRDAFAFELVGLSPDWKAVVFDMTNLRNLVPDFSEAPIQERQWVQSNGGLMVMLATRPPIDCASGKLAVHVTREASGDTAMVEFDLDPKAQGTGCYFL